MSQCECTAQWQRINELATSWRRRGDDDTTNATRTQVQPQTPTINGNPSLRIREKVKEPALLLLLKCCNLCKKHSIMAWGSIILCRDISPALLRFPVCRSAYHPGQRASPSVLKTLNRLNPSNPSRLHQPKSFVQRNAPSQPKRATKMTSTTSHRSLRDTARKQPAHDTLICPPILATHQFRFFGF